MTALFGKEWRRLLRLPLLPWVLAGYILLPLAGGVLVQKTASAAPTISFLQSSWVGAQVLTGVASWQVILLAVITPWLGAGLLAGEAEEGTLEPLLASAPSLAGMVIAKFLALLLFAAQFIAFGLPVYGLATLAGGVHLGLVARTAAVEAATVLVLAGVSLLLSAGGRRTGSVALAGVALGLAFTLGNGLIAGPVSGPADVYNPAGTRAVASPAAAGGFLQVRIGADGVKEGIPVPLWLLVNPLVGLNSALDAAGGVQGLFALAWDLGPVYKGYALWQVQAAGAAAVALTSLLLSSLWLWARTRAHWPFWLYRRTRVRTTKGMTADGPTG